MKKMILSSLWMFCCLIIINAQNVTDNQKVIGKKQIEKQLDLVDFDAFDLQITKANVYVKSGNEQAVTVKGQADILELISTEVIDGEWIISLPESVKKHKYISIYLTVPNLQSVSLSSGGQITGTGEFYDNNGLQINSSGAGMIRLTGFTQKVYVRNTGTGIIDLSDFVTTDCSIRIEGIGICKVHPNSILDAQVFGGGKVFYRTRK